MTERKLCRNCRWAADRGAGLSTPSRYYEWFCDHPSSLLPERPPSLVTGEVPPRQKMGCEQARGYGDGAYCGPDGRYWEPR